MLDLVVLDLDTKGDLVHDLRYAGQDDFADRVEALVDADVVLDVDVDA